MKTVIKDPNFTVKVEKHYGMNFLHVDVGDWSASIRETFLQKTVEYMKGTGEDYYAVADTPFLRKFIEGFSEAKLVNIVLPEVGGEPSYIYIWNKEVTNG